MPAVPLAVPCNPVLLMLSGKDINGACSLPPSPFLGTASRNVLSSGVGETVMDCICAQGISKKNSYPKVSAFSPPLSDCAYLHSTVGDLSAVPLQEEGCQII